MPRPVGMFAKAHMETIKRAELLQAQAALYIQEQFGFEDEPEMTLENLSWDRFVRELDSADRNDTRDACDEKIGRLVSELLPAVFEQEPQ